MFIFFGKKFVLLFFVAKKGVIFAVRLENDAPSGSFFHCGNLEKAKVLSHR